MTLTLFTIFLSSFVIALSGAIMPGPVLTVTISESLRRGCVAGPLLILGHGILEFALVVVLIAGLAPLFTHDATFIIISLCGGIILAWMAYTMFRELPVLSLSGAQKEKSPKNLVLAGILLSIANPYWAIWWATIGIAYIFSSIEYGMPGLLAFFTGHLSGDLLWYALVSYGISRGGRFLNDTFYRRLIGICASFLGLFSAYFIFSGISRLAAT